MRKLIKYLSTIRRNYYYKERKRKKKKKGKGRGLQLLHLFTNEFLTEGTGENILKLKFLNNKIGYNYSGIENFQMFIMKNICYIIIFELFI